MRSIVFKYPYVGMKFLPTPSKLDVVGVWRNTKKRIHNLESVSFGAYFDFFSLYDNLNSTQTIYTYLLIILNLNSLIVLSAVLSIEVTGSIVTCFKLFTKLFRDRDSYFIVDFYFVMAICDYF